MKWEDLRRSSNVEDLRGANFSRSAGSRGSLRMIIPIAKFLLRTKVGRVVLAVGAVGWFGASFMGYDPLSLVGNQPQQQQSSYKITKEDKKEGEFVSAVLAQTEDVWGKIFREHGAKYREPKLVLFRNGVNSGCGYASSQTGPFYCSADNKVYLDLVFFDELSSRFGAPGDFAQAYVIAHEIGHHVQKLQGTLTKSHNLKKRASKTQANAIQVKIELQADCYAGIWAHYLNGVLEDGDIDEALHAASAIGDDTLQKQAQGYVVPDSFTHGSSADRMKWFKRGYVGGNLNSCQTGI